MYYLAITVTTKLNDYIIIIIIVSSKIDYYLMNLFHIYQNKNK